MTCAFVEHTFDVRGEGHLAHERAREDLLALVRFGLGKSLTHMRELDVTAFKVAKSEDLHGFGYREKLIDFELNVRGDVGKVRCSVVGLRRNRLYQTSDEVGRDMREDGADAWRDDGTQPLYAPCRHLHIDTIDQIFEGDVRTIARMRKIDLQFGHYAAGVAREQEHADVHQDDYLDVVRDENCALDGQLALGPELKKYCAQVLCRQHIEGGEGIVHQEDVRMDDKRERK